MLAATLGLLLGASPPEWSLVAWNKEGTSLLVEERRGQADVSFRLYDAAPAKHSLVLLSKGFTIANGGHPNEISDDECRERLAALAKELEARAFPALEIEGDHCLDRFRRDLIRPGRDAAEVMEKSEMERSGTGFSAENFELRDKTGSGPAIKVTSPWLTLYDDRRPEAIWSLSGITFAVTARAFVPPSGRMLVVFMKHDGAVDLRVYGRAGGKKDTLVLIETVSP